MLKYKIINFISQLKLGIWKASQKWLGTTSSFLKCVSSEIL